MITAIKLKAHIKDIVQIQTGIYSNPVLNGEVYYIQARHFNQNREFISTVTPDLPLNDKLQKYFLQKGDVLVASKGFDHFAVDYKEIIKPAVASSMFIVLRIENKEQILPEFLAWYINHPKTQTKLSGTSKGTALPSLRKNDIGDLEIMIPTIQIQKAILELHALRQKEKTLNKQIETLRETQLQQQLINAIK
jgi:restriction endonuclease S subunit